MRTTLRFLIPAGAALILILCLTAKSWAADSDSKEGFSSKDQSGGHWYADDIQTLSPVTHQGKHVTMMINNVLYEQILRGDFVNANTIQGTIIRHKRSDNTTTTLQVTLVFTSPTTIRMQWIALDANSDLHMGQSGLMPVIWLPDVKPVVIQPPITPPPVEPPSKPYDPMAHID